MRAVVKTRQIADQPQSPNRAPTNVFHHAVIDLCLRSDHHRAAGELAVAKSQEQAAALVEILCAVDSHWEGASVKACESQKDRGLVADLSPCAEPSGAQRSDVRRKTHAQQINEMNHTGAVAQSHHVA